MRFMVKINVTESTENCLRTPDLVAETTFFQSFIEISDLFNASLSE